MNKKALITGITGQDGAYLAEFLLNKGYEVHGLKRRTSLFNTDRIDHLYVDPHNNKSNFHLHFGDMTDTSNLIKLIYQTKPDEIYNLAAMSHVRVSVDILEYVAAADGRCGGTDLRGARDGLGRVGDGHCAHWVYGGNCGFCVSRQSSDLFVSDRHGFAL